MEIDYTVSKREISSIMRSITKAVWRRHNNARRKYTLQAMNILLWVPVGFFIAYSFGRSEDLGQWALYGVGLGASVVWIYRLVVRKVINQLPSDPGPSLGPLKLIADESGLTVAGTGSKSTTEWSGIRTIEDVGDYVFIFIDNNVAHYVPKKAIGDEAAVKAFIGKIVSLKEQYAT